jgi:hypothetical protein
VRPVEFSILRTYQVSRGRQKAVESDDGRVENNVNVVFVGSVFFTTASLTTGVVLLATLQRQVRLGNLLWITTLEVMEGDTTLEKTWDALEARR